jgi:hypothetical protein
MHNGKPGHENMYSIADKLYRDGEVDIIDFAIDKANLLILMAKMISVSIDELPKNSKTKSGPNKSKQTKLL